MTAALNRIASRLLAAWLLAAALAAPGRAAIDVTASEARAFLGGRSGKLVYLKNQLNQIYYLDFSDSVLVEHKVAEDAYCLSPMIHPDGSRIVYESSAGIYIRYLQENSPTRYRIYAGIAQGNHSLEPHWWIHPKTKEEYIIFTTGDISDLEWPPKSGNTYMQKIVDNMPSGPALTLLPFMMASGRSKNGVWGGTSHHSTGMYKLYPDKVENAFFSSTNWVDSGSWGACNGSISPSDDPARQNRLMHLNSYLALKDGEIFENHKAIVIRSYDDKDVSSPIWEMGTPGIRCNNDSSGNLFWDQSEWSTDEEYFTAVGSKVISDWTDGDAYIGRISYTGNNQIRRILKGGGLNHYPHLWIKTGVAPAKIRLDKAALEFVSLKKDSAGPPADTIHVSNSGDGALPALRIDNVPEWIRIDILDNGGSAPKLVVSVDRAAAGLGDHTAKVKVSYGQAADSAFFTVRLKYSDPVLTALRAEPAQAVLKPGDTVAFSVVGLDQTGAVMVPQPSITWGSIDDLPISASGKVVADSSLWTLRSFRAYSGSLVCTTTVFISKHIMKVDVGAAKDSLAEGWISDEAFVSPGWPRASRPGLPVILKAADHPAPDQVYRSVRHTPGSLRLDSLPKGHYAVRCFFSSPGPGVTEAVKGMTIKVEGEALIEDQRLPSRPDSGIRGGTCDFLATINDGNGLEIGFEGLDEAVSLAGLEVYDVGDLPITVAYPNGGESAHVGDTLSIRWTATEMVSSVGIQISVDSGKGWIPVTRTRSVNLGEADWGDFRWIIPDSLDGRSLTTAHAQIYVYDYFGTDRDRSDAVFSILPSEHTGLKAAAPALRTLTIGFAAGSLEIGLPRPGPYRIVLTDARGRTVLSGQGVGKESVSLPAGGLARGVYRLTFICAGFQATRSVTLLD
ncbi:MAG: hypothetical protein ABI036_03000 [Fibrobacteria bacterium]